ncbi:MAG: hypothetical protein JNG85_16595 [Spirochaetaceae bacterium]|nr:hypothetical protein [Spirochaetaceae bacterium]
MKEMHPVGTKRCLGCIQWDGRRSFDPSRTKIQADAGSEGRCLLRHVAVKGSHTCEQHFPLR